MEVERYKRLFEGFEITHADIKSKSMMVFFVQQTQFTEEEFKQPDELMSRTVLYVPELSTENEGFGAYEWNSGIRQGYVHIGDHITMVESFGTVWESRTDNKWHSVIKGSKALNFLSGLKQIGNTLFICAYGRKVYKRLDHNDWFDLIDDEQHAYVYADIKEREAKGIKHTGYPMGFNQLDGFHEEDIYASGSHGAFWRYDGKQWFRVDLPSNRDVRAIVCAPNDKVYIVMVDGQIIMGREDQWKTLENKVDQSYSFAANVSSAAWFKGKLYMATPFDLYVLDGEDFSKYQFPENGHKQSSFGWVTACEEALLSYGNDQALIFDGQEWSEIINNPLFAQS